MELRQLAYFEAVVRHGGFSRAAEQLHVAQPAVSAQIRRLELELGTALLERTTRRVRLTPAGELVLTRARSALAQVEGARADLAELATVSRGSCGSARRSCSPRSTCPVPWPDSTAAIPG